MRPVNRYAISAMLSLLTVAGAAAQRAASHPEAGGTAGAANVTGTVTCDGEPVGGVLVSDGILFERTDSLGRYALRSKKYQGVVFVITPSGYEPVCRRGILPQFWAALDSRRPDKPERHDFQLVRRDNTRHRMILSADMHLSGRNEDLLQFKRTYVPAVRREAERAAADSMAVYSIVVGDLSSSAHWYSSEFDVGDALHSMVACKYPVMLHTAMGEQDYDGAVPCSGTTDHNAERMYVYSCGPKYYSMNIGEVHYVILDNTVFLNEPGEGPYPTEIVGRRNYDRFVSSDQLAWLRRDLSFVDRERPVVVCMHHSAFRASTKGSMVCNFKDDALLDSLVGCFDGFGDVHFYTAHSHRKGTARVDELPGITEHALPSASGNAWVTAYNGFQHLCPDGTDPGFEVLTAERDSLSWQYVTELHGTRTFRAYDMNCVGKYYREDFDTAWFVGEYPKRIDYGDSSFADMIYINWWGLEPGAKLEVFENGKPLKTKQVYHDDPLYTVSYDVFRARNSRTRPKIGGNTCRHMFCVKASAPDSEITIRATDRFGRVCEEKMVRPKEFSAEMF